MQEIYNDLLNDDLMNTPYKDNQEYLSTEFFRVRRILNLYLKALNCSDFEKSKLEALEEIEYINNFIQCRKKVSKNKIFAGEYFKKICGFSEIEYFILMCFILIKSDNKYLSDFLKIENMSKITYSAVIKLYFFEKDIFLIKNYYSLCSDVSSKMNLHCFNDENLDLDDGVFLNIVTNACKELNFSESNLYFPSDENSSLIIREDKALKLSDFLKKSEGKNRIFIYGCEGIGKKTIVKRVCDILSKSVMFIDLSFYSGKNFIEDLLSICREAFFNRSFICFDNINRINKEDFGNCLSKIISVSSNFSDVIFFLSSEKVYIQPYLKGDSIIELELENLSNEENFTIWKNYLSKAKYDKSLDIHELANKFDFTPKQIKETVERAVNNSRLNNNKLIDKNEICNSSYGQVTEVLLDKVTVIKKKHTWDELVLQKSQKDIIKVACDRVKYKHIVYDKWGMGKRVLYGRGLSMLFSGPPGTGKTMAAQVVSSELGLEIYKVDLSKIVSKYIGETEKNLREVFDSAKRSNVILLFDETDAILGKRTEVKDSHDKNANMETSYLLQKMEEYDGITIMTTNFTENIDKAFFRRISYVVHFTMPDYVSRKEIWQKMFPKETPISDDVDFEFLAKNFEISGGNIKNIVLSSSFMAASESKKVEMKHVVKALEYEIKKQGKMVSKNDFAEYSYLI